MKKALFIASACLLMSMSSASFAISPTGHYTLDEVNAMSLRVYEKSLNKIFERAPWVISEMGKRRPHKSVMDMYISVYAGILTADREMQLSLIRSHPDLACKDVRAEVTPSSSKEQASAGLDECTPEEAKALKDGFNAYRKKFRMPFVLAVRGFQKAEIFEQLKLRMENPQELEIQNALQNISKVVMLRLLDAVK